MDIIFGLGLFASAVAIWSQLKLYKQNKRVESLTAEIFDVESSIPHITQEAVKDSLKRSKAVLTGQAAEQIAPYLKDFPYYPGDCRFFGSPIDLIAFPGAVDDNIEKVVLIEIKTGNSRLSKRQRQIKAAIEAGRVEWLEYRIDVTSITEQ